MSNNILEPIPASLNDYLNKFGHTVLSNTTPAALPSTTNVTFQKDAYGNISACVSGSGGTIPSTTDLLSGDGAGGVADSNIAPANVPLLNAANNFTTAGNKFNSTITTGGLSGTDMLIGSLGGSSQGFDVNQRQPGHQVGVFSSPGTDNALFLKTTAGGPNGGKIVFFLDESFSVPNSFAVVSNTCYFPSSVLAATATAGAATLPATPTGFIVVSANGTNVKIPYYSN